MMGQAEATGNGIIPISWQELRAFRLENELDLTLWDRQVLREMSEAYVSEYYAATDPQRKAPWTNTLDEIDEEAELIKARSLMATIRAFRKNK